MDGLAHFESQQHGEPDHWMAVESQQRDGQLDNFGPRLPLTKFERKKLQRPLESEAI